MAEGPRPMPYRVEWPLTPNKAEQIDEMFQILFDDIRNGAIEQVIQITEANFVGTLPATSGGTGLTNYSIGDILYADSSSSLARLTVGSSGRVLQSDGSAPVWGLVDFDNMEPAASASTLIGRRSGSAGNWEPITLGTNLSMSGTTLNASGGGGGGGPEDGYWSPLTNGDPGSPELIFDGDGDAIAVWTPA